MAIGRYVPKKRDPKKLEKIWTFFKLAPGGLGELLAKRLQQKSKDPVELVRNVVKTIKPNTGEYKIKLDTSTYQSDMWSHTPDQVLKRKSGSPAAINQLFLALMRGVDVNTNVTNFHPLMAQSRDSTGAVKHLAVVFIQGPVPAGVKHKVFASDPELRKKFAKCLPPSMRRNMDTVSAIVVDVETGRIGVQGIIEPRTDAQAASMGYANMGRWYTQKGKLKQANEVLSAALMLWKSNYEAYANLAKLKLKEGAPSEAMNAILRSVYIEPQNPEAHMVAAECFAQLSNPEEAIKSYQKAALMNPDDYVSRKALGKLYYEAGREAVKKGEKEEALKFYKKAGDSFKESERRLNMRSRSDQVIANAQQTITAQMAALQQAVTSIEQELTRKPPPLLRA